MESIGYFFRRIFDEIIYKLSYQVKYKINDIAESKIREVVEKPSNKCAKDNQKTTTDCRE
jgi:hypothetical protein